MTAEWVAFRTGINLLPMKSLLREVFGASSRPVERGGAADAGTAAPVLYGRGIGMDLAETVRRRRANFRRLAGDLQGAGVTVPFLEAPEGGCPQALPVLVPEPVGTVRRLRRSGVDACRWPASEGVVTDRSTFPGARSWSRRVVLLPVHQGLSDGNLGRLSERVLRVLGDP